MFPRLPKRPSLAFGFMAATTVAIACGPWFPSTIIDQGDAGLLASPSISFRHVLQQALLPPAEFKAVPSPQIRYQDTGYAAQTIAAEIDDLRAAGASLAVVTRHLQRRRQLQSRPESAETRSTPDLPAEFFLYYTGAQAFRKGDLSAAHDAFESVLALPADERRFKSVWAAYMLGKIAARSGDRAMAADWFVRTREFARVGFVDSTGLAAASLGEEARLAFDQKDWLTACELYLRQYATGDVTALNSLRFTAAGAMSDSRPETLARFAKQPGPRAVITARLLERFGTPEPGKLEDVYPMSYDNEPPDPEPVIRRWLIALETENITSTHEAGVFALAAYQAGAFAESARWLDLAPADEPDANWLRAKLALRDGRIDEGAAMLANLVRQASVPFGFGDNVSRLQGELAQLRLARRDYTEALGLLLRGGYWQDAAYIAERVLTIEELTRFIKNNPNLTEDLPRLRHLLGRRLVRAGRLSEAGVYFPKEYAVILAEFGDHLKAGADPSRPAVARGLSLAHAARILRRSGMELQGAELAPDHAHSNGGYWSNRSMLDARGNAGGIAAPSDDEAVRAMAVHVSPNRRFHYRYRAADLAWEAARLLPDNSLELANLLIEAGGWIKARDPHAADRFYKALVNRCPETDPGRAARAKHWFPSP